jgi:hypothetical protein
MNMYFLHQINLISRGLKNAYRNNNNPTLYNSLYAERCFDGKSLCRTFSIPFVGNITRLAEREHPAPLITAYDVIINLFLSQY